jgi:hypothetical protein
MEDRLPQSYGIEWIFQKNAAIFWKNETIFPKGSGKGERKWEVGNGGHGKRAERVSLLRRLVT